MPRSRPRSTDAPRQTLAPTGCRRTAPTRRRMPTALFISNDADLVELNFNDVEIFQHITYVNEFDCDKQNLCTTSTCDFVLRTISVRLVVLLI